MIFLEKKFVHIEIPIRNIKSAKKFYETIFSWEVTTETGMPGYYFFKTGETGVGGAFFESEKVAKGEIMLHIQTDDINATLETIVDLGGKIIREKTDIGSDFGFYAVFEDCCGNQLGLWSKK